MLSGLSRNVIDGNVFRLIRSSILEGREAQQLEVGLSYGKNRKKRLLRMFVEDEKNYSIEQRNPALRSLSISSFPRAISNLDVQGFQ